MNNIVGATSTTFTSGGGGRLNSPRSKDDIELDCPEIIYKMNAEGNGLVVVSTRESDAIFVDIPESAQHDGMIFPVTDIGDNAFSGYSNLEKMAIPKTVTHIGDRAFYECDILYGIVIPDSITEIGEYAFYGCINLKKINIPPKVKSIPDGVFYDCTMLERVVIPEGVRSIGRFTFSGCHSLTHCSIPDSVTTIGECAFSDCTALARITLPKNCVLGDDVFANTPVSDLIKDAEDE